MLENNLSNEVLQIAQRIHEMREICDFSVEEMAALKEIEMKAEGLSNTVKECEDFIGVIKEEGEKLKRLSVPVSEMSDEEFLQAIKNLRK